jgi:hypothetical protein
VQFFGTESTFIVLEAPCTEITTAKGDGSIDAQKLYPNTANNLKETSDRELTESYI